MVFLQFTNFDYMLLALAYFLGAIPFALLVAKSTGIGDIREQGSGNIGATNMLRVGGKKRAILVLLLDVLKGVLAVMLARAFADSDIAVYAAAAAVIGHVFPLFLKFRGGKGVATSLAVLLTISPAIGIFACLSWLVVFVATKISSLSAICAMIVTPVFALLINQGESYAEVYLCLFLGLLVIARHEENIKRLMRGEERKS